MSSTKTYPGTLIISLLIKKFIAFKNSSVEIVSSAHADAKTLIQSGTSPSPMADGKPYPNPEIATVMEKRKAMRYALFLK